MSGLDAAEEVAEAVGRNPVAATSLVLLLRGAEARTIATGIIAESATYSALQAGQEHQSWLAQRTRRERPPEKDPPLRMARDGARLRLALSRPRLRNAFDARMREALIDGLTVAASDASIEEVLLTGDGPSFCSGGDLDEFGTLEDPAAAHLLRVGRSAAGVLVS